MRTEDRVGKWMELTVETCGTGGRGAGDRDFMPAGTSLRQAPGKKF